MTDFCIVYSTFAHRDEAFSVGRALLEERLVACVNVSAPVDSLYRWEGKIQQDSEVVLLAKTTRAKAADTIARVTQLHSYALPCVLSLPIESGNAEFLQWITSETA